MAVSGNEEKSKKTRETKKPPVRRNSSSSTTSSSADVVRSPWSSQGNSRIPGLGNKPKTSKSESDTSSVKTVSSPVIDPSSLSTVNVSSSEQLPSLKSEHRVKEKCPCNQSLGASWKLDCVKCGQFWHADCVGLKGLTEKSINNLTQYLCPFCFVSPVPTIPTTVDVCHICRNTLSLQQTNRDYEAWLASSKIKNMSECCNMLGHVDFEKLSSNIDKLSQFDYRLRHLLLNENSLKGLDIEIRGLTEKLNSFEPPPINTSMANMSYDKSLESITNNINKLQEDLHLLTNTAAPSIPAPSAESTDRLLNDISSKLNTLCDEESGISAGLGELKQSIDSVQSRQFQFPPPCSPPPPCPPDQSSSLPQVPDQHIPHIPHGQVPVSSTIHEFIQAEEAEKLTRFLESCTFKSENGHSVCSFGTPYEYTGSKSSDDVPPIPDELKPLLEKINDVQTAVYQSNYPEQSQLPPVINSFLMSGYMFVI